MDLRAIVCVLISLTSSLWRSQAFAWDPTTLATGAQAVSGIIGGLDKADEVAGIGFALSDLLSELGVEAGADDELNHAVTRLEELNSKALELRWSERDIKEALASDLNQANSFKEKLRALKNMISASKRIAEIMGVRPKAGDRASQIQSIKINSMILEELQAMRRAQFLSYLESKESKTKRNILLQQIVEKERK